jgi:hypothetical protein
VLGELALDPAHRQRRLTFAFDLFRRHISDTIELSA